MTHLTERIVCACSDLVGSMLEPSPDFADDPGAAPSAPASIHFTRAPMSSIALAASFGTISLRTADFRRRHDWSQFGCWGLLIARRVTLGPAPN
jgi:hypothetical protein